MAKVRRGFSFQQMEIKKPNYSKFNLSHDHLCALGSGYLVPLWWTEGVPGDTINCNLSSFIRLLALSSPMLQREDIFVRAFKVPLRIIASDKDLDLAYAGGKDGVHPDFPFFECDPTNMNVGSLYDYLQLPLPYEFDSSTKSWKKIDSGYIFNNPKVSAWPFLAYHRIYMDHFRNEDTEDDFLELFDLPYSELDDVRASSGFGDLIDYEGELHLDSLHRVAWERDYFTSALGQSQRGSQVTIPLLGSAPVVPDPSIAPQLNITTPGAQQNLPLYRDPSGNLQESEVSNTALKWKNSGLVVNGSEFSGIGAIALRLAMNLQAFLERNNIAGYRMIGNILAHFGVQSSNRLMEEAEYLGGIKAPITISAVNQTSASEDGSTPQGTQVGTAQSAFSGHLFRTFCEEPCIIMVVGYITAKSSYSQGLARKWTRRSYLDYYWPEFQTIGEQEILNQEVFFQFGNASEGQANDNTWAYQARYSEYKYEPDTIAGDFRTTLSYWHQSRMFTSLPAYNNDFVKSNPSDRVFAVDSETYPRPYLGEFYFDCQAVRPMDKYAQSKLW